jgi:hypothetical protein
MNKRRAFYLGVVILALLLIGGFLRTIGQLLIVLVSGLWEIFLEVISLAFELAETLVSSAFGLVVLGGVGYMGYRWLKRRRLIEISSRRKRGE